METIALEQTCNILSGYAFKSKEYVSKGIRIIRIANVQKGYIEDKLPCYYPYDNKKASSDYALVRDDLLVSLTGNVGRVGLVPDNLLPAALNQRVACLRVKGDSPLTKEFIYAVLNSDQFEREAIESSNGVAQKNLSVNWLKQYQLPLMTKTEQASFCKRFSIINSNCLRIRTVASRLDNLIKSRFVEMFGEEHQLVELSEVCETFNGDRSSNYPSADERINAGVPFVNAGNLTNGVISFNNMEYVSEEKYHQLSGGRIQTGDLLYCLRGSLGKCALANFDKGTIASSLMIIRCNQERIQPKYLYETMASPFVERQMASANNGSSQPNLSAKSVKQFKIPLPPLALQQEFADFVSQVDKLRFETCYAMYLLCAAFTLL